MSAGPRRTQSPQTPFTSRPFSADLVESVRVHGKPRQRHIAYLVGFTEQQFKDKHTGKVHEAQQFLVWENALDRLDELGDRISAGDRGRVEAALAARIGMPKPTREDLGAFNARRRVFLDGMAAAFKVAP